MSGGLDDLFEQFNTANDAPGGSRPAHRACAPAVVDLTDDEPARQLPRRPTAGTPAAPPRPRSSQQPPGSRNVQQKQQQQPVLSAEDRLEQKVQRLIAKAGRYPVGPNLQGIRQEQEAMGVKEYYGVDHLRRLLQYETSKSFTAGRKVYCKDVHGPGCQECKTCHFCRQRTVDVKTYCPCADTRNQEGSAGRGYWCAACLHARMGESIEEALNNRNWRCPACRDICNCSGKSCQRINRGLQPTSQLVHEAHNLGYKSVAHYLILTHLDATGAFAAPMPRIDLTARQQQQQQRQAAAAAAGLGVGQTDVPGLGATAAGLRAIGAGLPGQRQRAAEQQRRQLLQACQQVFARPEQDMLTAVLAERGMGQNILDPNLAVDDDLEENNMLGSSFLDALSASAFARSSSSTPRPLGSSQWQQQQQLGGMRQQQQQRVAANSAGSAPAAAGGAGGAGNAPGMQGSAAAEEQDMPAYDADADVGFTGDEDVGLGPFGGLGVLGIESFGTTSQPDRGPSPVGRVLPDAEVRSRPPAGAAAAAAGGGGSSSLAAAGLAAVAAAGRSDRGQQTVRQGPSSMPPPAPRLPRGQQQQQQQQQLQQQQQCRQGQPALAATVAAGEAAAGPAGSAAAPAAPQHPLLQKLQQADDDFRPGDLPGSDAPGYRDTVQATHTVTDRPIRQQQQHQYNHNYQQQQQQQQRLQQGWSNRPGQSGAWGAAAASNAGANRAATAGAYSGGSIRSPDVAAGFVRDAAVAGLADFPPSKRPRMDSLGVGAAYDDDDVCAAQPQQQQQRQQEQQAQQQPQQQDGHAQLQSEQQPSSVPAWLLKSRLAVHQDLAKDSCEPQEARALLYADTNAVLLDGPQGVRCLQLLSRSFNASAVGRDIMRKRCMAMLDQAFCNSGDWDAAMVVNNCYGACEGSIDKLRRDTTLLLELSKLLPLEVVACDVVRRLQGLEPFLDFKKSDPLARSVLLNACISLFDILMERGSTAAAVAAVDAAVQEFTPPTAPIAAAAAATAFKRAAAARRPADLAAVKRAVDAAVSDTGHAMQGMLGLVKLLLECIGVLQGEFLQLRKYLSSPSDILGPISIGPIKWQAAHGSPQVVIDERLINLQAQADADSNAIESIMANLISKSQGLPRRVAAALLAGPQLGAMLDLEVPWSVEARKHTLLGLSVLITQAAPDLQNDDSWRVQDLQQLRTLLQQLQQQHQHQQPANGQIAASVQHALAMGQLGVLQQVLDSRLQPAERITELRLVDQHVKQHVLLPLEKLIAAEYVQRENWLKDQLTSQQAQQPQQPQQQQPQQQQFQPSWQQQIAGVGAHSSQQLQRQHLLQLGTVKVDLMVAVYALQLQSAAVTWQAIEKQLVAPAVSLTQLLELYKTPNLRRMVLYLTAGMTSQVPSLLRWQQQQQQQQYGLHGGSHGGWQGTRAAPATPSSAAVAAAGLPAEWVLRLWLYSLFDLPSNEFLISAWNASLALSRNPKTAMLFRGCPWVQRQPKRLLSDRTGKERAIMLKRVVEAALAKFEGAARFHALRTLLGDLVKVLHSRQQEVELQCQPRATLRWQRSCMPGLLGLVEVIAGLLISSNCLAPGQLHTGTSAAAAPPSIVVSELRKVLQELMQLASSWIKCGVVAVCTLGAQVGSSSGGREGVGTGQGSSGGFKEGGEELEARQLLEMSAIAELHKYIAVLVFLAGNGCLMDGASTSKWPADTSNNSTLLAQVWARKVQQYQQQQRQRQQQQQQQPLRQQWQPQQQRQATAPLSLTCLRELVTVLVQAPAAGDQLQPQEQVLFNHVAEVLVGLGGMPPPTPPAPTAAAEAAVNPAASPPAAAAARSASPTGAAAAAVCGGYASPGLLFMLLGVHIRMVLDASSDKGSPAAHGRAVNALHLVKSMLDQPGMQQMYGQQLLLLCLSRSLIKLLPCSDGTSGGSSSGSSSSGSPAVQLQVYQLLHKLVCGPCAQQLMPPEGRVAEQEIFRVDFQHGALLNMRQVPMDKLQKLMLWLLPASLRGGLSLVAAAIGPAVASLAEQQVQALAEKQQQQQQQQLQQDQMSQQAPGEQAAPANANRSHAQLLLPLQLASREAAANSTRGVTGPPLQESPELKGWLAALNTSSSTVARTAPAAPAAASRGPNAAGMTSMLGAHGAAAAAAAAAAAVAAKVKRPDSFCWTLAECVLTFFGALARQGGWPQQQVLNCMPFLKRIIAQGAAHVGQPLVQAYKELMLQLPPPQQQRYRLPERATMLPPATAAAPPTSAAAGRQQLDQQARHRQQQQRQACVATAAGSQACSAAPARPRQQQPMAAAAAGEQQQVSQLKRRRIQVPAASQVFSEAGGRAASCYVAVTEQAGPQMITQQHQQQTVPQPRGINRSASATVAASVADSQQGATAAAAGAGEDDDADECTSSMSGACGGAPRHTTGSGGQQQQRQQQHQQQKQGWRVEQPSPPPSQQQQQMGSAKQQRDQGQQQQQGHQQQQSQGDQQQQQSQCLQPQHLLGVVSDVKCIQYGQEGRQAHFVTLDIGSKKAMLHLKGDIHNRVASLLAAQQMCIGDLCGVSDLQPQLRRHKDTQKVTASAFISTQSSRLYVQQQQQQQQEKGSQAIDTNSGSSKGGRSSSATESPGGSDDVRHKQADAGWQQAAEAAQAPPPAATVPPPTAPAAPTAAPAAAAHCIGVVGDSWWREHFALLQEELRGQQGAANKQASLPAQQQHRNAAAAVAEAATAGLATGHAHIPPAAVCGVAAAAAPAGGGGSGGGASRAVLAEIQASQVTGGAAAEAATAAAGGGGGGGATTTSRDVRSAVAAVDAANTAAVGPMQHPAASAIGSSQATVKYMTQPSQIS